MTRLRRQAVLVVVLNKAVLNKAVLVVVLNKARTAVLLVVLNKAVLVVLLNKVVLVVVLLDKARTAAKAGAAREERQKRKAAKTFRPRSRVRPPPFCPPGAAHCWEA
jgi:hypothetical protein